MYFWQGGQSTTDEKAASAINAVRVDDELGGKAIQGRRSILDFGGFFLHKSL